MKQEFTNFLFNFTTDEEYFTEFEVTPDHRILINKLLNEMTDEDFGTYVKKLGERWFLGFEFFYKCIDFIDEKNKEKFLKLVWGMFSDQMDSSKTDGFHPWMGQFNPFELDEEVDFETRASRWFREGTIRYEFSIFSDEDILFPLGYTYSLGWWRNIEIFLDEFCEFQTKDFLLNLLNRLSDRLKQDDRLNLAGEMSKHELLEAFKTRVGSDLNYFDSDNVDWD